MDRALEAIVYFGQIAQVLLFMQHTSCQDK